MARLSSRDIRDINKWFEDALCQLSKIDRKEKMGIRKKIRDEVYLLLSWQKPTASMIISRLEERLRDVFKAMPYGLKDDLIRLLAKKTEKSE